jgi:hypothetical protein
MSVLRWMGGAALGLSLGLALAACAGGAAKDAATGAGGAGGRYIYLGQSKVFAMPVSGGAPVTLVEEDLERGFVNDGIALDAKRGHIYWTNMGRAAENDGYIMRADANGANKYAVVERGGTFTPKQLKIDEAGGKLYWADREGMAIMRANLDGSEIETIVRTGNPVADKGKQELWCVGVALDVARGHVYWTQKGGDNAGAGMIRRASIKIPEGQTAANRRDIVTLFARLPEPIDLDLDLASRTIYWTDRGDNTVSRAPMDPPAGFSPALRTDRQILVRDVGEAIGVALDLKRGRMAWTSLEGEVAESALDGSDRRTLASGQGMLTGILLAE